MQINIDEKKYNIIKKTIDSDGITVIAKERYKHCYYCKKRFEAKGNSTLFWVDKNKYQRSGQFCKTHYIKIKHVLKEIRSN